MIICHGIPGSQPDPHDRGYFGLAEALVAAGYHAVLFNFRGCGDAGGDIDMRAWYEDLTEVSDLITDLPGVDPRAVHAVGFSAGGAIAAKAAAHDHLFAGLLLMATPADLGQIMPDDPQALREHFRALGLITTEAFPHDLKAWHRGFLELKPVRWLPFIAPRPVGIVHGDADTVVPVEHARHLYAAAFEPKTLTILADAPHQLRRDPRTTGLIIDWLDECAGRKQRHA